MKKIKALILSIFLFTFISSFIVGFSSWTFNNDRTQQYEKVPKEAQKVAYIGSGTSAVYYTTLEKAIEVANANSTNNPIIHVISGINYKMNNVSNTLKTITINSGVTLSLPFQGETEFAVRKVKNGTFSTDSDAKDAATTVEALLKPETYRTTQITIGKNIQIINNGIINVGGVTGSAGGGNVPAGQTCYKFSEIVLEGIDNNNYQLINNGVIKNHGRIIGTNRSVLGVENKANSKLISNFIVRENKGGSALVGLGGGLGNALINNLSFKVSPFNRVYMPNTMAKMKTNAGANIIGIANMYGNESNNECKISIVSSSTNALICITGSSYMISETYLDTLSDNSGNILISQYEKMKLDFYGDFTMQYMSMKLTVPKFGSREIKTDTVLFPISYYEEITLNSIGNNIANVSSSQNLKILPGGSIVINENVNFSIQKLAVYDQFTDNIGWGAHVYPKNIVGGNFEIGGSFNGTSEVGGLIRCKSNKAALKITSNSIISKEVKGKPGTSVSDSDYDNIKLIANGNISYNNNNPSKLNILNGVDYSGKVLNQSEYWSATINPTISILDTENGTSKTLHSGESITININELLPDEALFDISSFKWKIGGSSEKQTYSYTDGTLNPFIFSVRKVPILGSTTWKYTITLTAKGKNGEAVTCNSYNISVKK